MSILACVNVHQCDNCLAITSVNVLDESAHRHFKESWYDGLAADYCPKCKGLPLAQDVQKVERLAAEKRFGKKPEIKTEYVN